MTALRRRSFLTAIGGSLGGMALYPVRAIAAPPSFIAFGDSYTASFRMGVPSWADQIDGSDAATLLVNLAVSGSTIEGINRLRTFDGQVDSWITNYKSKGIPQRTVVYFGYNDLGKPLSGTERQYRVQIDRLIANGVTQGQRKLVFCLLHDKSHNPGTTINFRAKVKAWNNYVRSIANARANCVVVDLFTLIENVFRRPGRYGFTNLTVPSKTLSATTHLFADSDHFGQKGQMLIAKEIKPKLL